MIDPIPNLNEPNLPAEIHSHKHFYFGIAIVALLAGGALTLIAIQNFKTDEDILASQIVEIPKHQNQTKDWQAYRNEKYGFELGYPSGWIIDTTYSNKDFTLRGPPEDNEYMGGDTFWENYEWSPNPEEGPLPEPSDHKSLYLIVYKQPNYKTVADYFKSKNYPNVAKILEEKDFVSGKNVVGRQQIYENLDHPVGVQTVVTIFKKDDSFYVFQSPILSKEFHNQILSTFKFIEAQNKITIPPIISGAVWKEEFEPSLKNDFMVAYNNYKYQEDSKKRQQKFVKFSGHLWKATIGDESGNFNDFENSLKIAGWDFFQDLDNKSLSFNGPQADGALGSLWGYVKIQDNKLKLIGLSSRLVDYTDVSNGGPIEPKCPCTHELKVFESDEVDIDQLTL